MMKSNTMRSLVCGLSTGLALFVGGSVHAANVSEMNSCKTAVLGKSKFSDLPMAAVSVYPGKDEKHIHFTVRWDGLKADGNCKVSSSGYIKKVNIKQFHDGRMGNSNNGSWPDSNDLNGFYYDRHQGKWRDPKGRVCHTCTPENGFPNYSNNYNYNYNYQESQPKNKFERQMQRQLQNSLSDEDIRKLNSLGK